MPRLEHAGGLTKGPGSLDESPTLGQGRDMRARSLFLIASLLLALTASTSAHAKDLNGRFGVGLEQSLGGVSGLAVRYWPAEDFGILATVGAEFVTQTDFRFLNTTVVASTGFVYNFAESLHANFGAGLRFALGFTTDNTTDTGRTEFDIEIPLTAEFFLSDNFSVSVAVGVLIAIVPGGGAVLDHGDEPDDTNSIDQDTVRFGIGAITGNLGLMYYF
jgi:hypothetical protein